DNDSNKPENDSNKSENDSIKSESDILLEKLDDSDVLEKKKAIFKIGEKKIAKAVPKLISLLKNDEDPVVRNSAARALGKIGDREHLDQIVEVLIEALDDKDYYVRVNACWGLGKIKDSRAIPHLVKMVDPDQRVYSMGNEIVQSTKEEQVSVKLKEEGMKFSDVIVEAIKALGKIKDPKGLPVLIEALKDESDGAVRCAAALAMGKIKDKSAVPYLITALDDKYWYVRRDAAKALSKLKGKSAKAAPMLARKMTDMYDEVRAFSLKALIAIGKPAGTEIFKLFLSNPQDPKLQNFISNNLTKQDLGEILKNLIETERNPSKKQIYEEYLVKLATN
ncbi:MAG: HEAT repeat domain-containing protein, partial [Promethearchaeota archaeon]